MVFPSVLRATQEDSAHCPASLARIMLGARIAHNCRGSATKWQIARGPVGCISRHSAEKSDSRILSDPFPFVINN